MKANYETGEQRFRRRFPEEDICVWKEMYKNKIQTIVEGRLKHCQLHCSGFNKQCEGYEPMSTLNKIKQI